MTETDQLPEPIVAQHKIYKSNAIRIGTFLGGPLVAGYLIAENYKAFNEEDKARKTWIYAIVATIVIFGGVFFIPEQVNGPKIIIPLIYSWIVFYIVQSLQGANIDEHARIGGETYSWWRVIAVGLIGTVFTFVLLFIAIVVFNLAI